ncbi:MAG TPA: hypothetical protein VFQ53_10135 [Kofleriaceae bacterium]|nr:hypothetical protein [Kofleriaceae bacterium]
MRRDPADSNDLLAAYVDGVSELSPEERRRVEALLADDPAARADEAATRALLGELRELPAMGQAPDWAALERSIGDAVGPKVPRAWWRSWRFVLPGLALAATAAIVLVIAHGPAPQPREVVTAPVRSHDAPPVSAEPEHGVAALWLDGHAVELDPATAAELDAAFDDDELDDIPVDELIAPSDLAWIDELDDSELERAERWLDEPERGKG